MAAAPRLVAAWTDSPDDASGVELPSAGERRGEGSGLAVAPTGTAGGAAGSAGSAAAGAAGGAAGSAVAGAAGGAPTGSAAAGAAGGIPAGSAATGAAEGVPLEGSVAGAAGGVPVDGAGGGAAGGVPAGSAATAAAGGGAAASASAGVTAEGASGSGTAAIGGGGAFGAGGAGDGQRTEPAASTTRAVVAEMARPTDRETVRRADRFAGPVPGPAWDVSLMYRAESERLAPVRQTVKLRGSANLLGETTVELLASAWVFHKIQNISGRRCAG